MPCSTVPTATTCSVRDFHGSVPGVLGLVVGAGALKETIRTDGWAKRVSTRDSGDASGDGELACCCIRVETVAERRTPGVRTGELVFVAIYLCEACHVGPEHYEISILKRLYGACSMVLDEMNTCLVEDSVNTTLGLTPQVAGQSSFLPLRLPPSYSRKGYGLHCM